MYRFFFRFFAITLTILTANLLTNAIGNYMVTYKNHVRPVVFTLIGMAITVIVFYPLFMKLEDWVKRLSAKFLKSARWGSKYIGLFLMFFVAISVLFYFYAKMWYHLDFFRILLDGNIKEYL